MQAYTVTKLAKELDVKRDRIYEYIANGELKAFRLKLDKNGSPTGDYRIPKSEVERFIAAHSVRPRPTISVISPKSPRYKPPKTRVWYEDGVKFDVEKLSRMRQ